MIQVSDLFSQTGEAGKRLSGLGAAEGAAGNLSVCIREEFDIPAGFANVQSVDLPLQVPELAGARMIITGSGCRLRDIQDAPTVNLAFVVVEDGGKTGKMFTANDAKFQRVTSEFNSHLAVHYDQMKLSDMNIHVVLHAQPSYLTYLSHIQEYQDETYFNQHIYRWQPETILSIPQGIGVLPFIVNSSDEQMEATASKMRKHLLVIWSQHGVVARANDSALKALDLIEYAEAAAHYEYLNLAAGGKSDGLSPAQIRDICKEWNIVQQIY